MLTDCAKYMKIKPTQNSPHKWHTAHRQKEVKQKAAMLLSYPGLLGVVIHPVILIGITQKNVHVYLTKGEVCYYKAVLVIDNAAPKFDD